VIRENKSNGRRQTVLSMVIISILVLIGAGIVITQSRFNPAILQKDALLPTVSLTGQDLPPAAIEAFIPLPPNLKPLTAPEEFDAGTLSDKINGKAELYLSAGFSGLISQRYRDKIVSDLWIEAFVYDMDSGKNAFAVFSAQRRENAESLDLAQYAYRSPNAVFLIHGQYYIEFIASQASSQVLQSMELLAVTFIRNTPAETITIAEQDLFPKPDLIAGSIALIATDAFGYEQLDQVYTAEYRVNDEPAMAYLSRRQAPDEAQDLAVSYGKFLLNFGGQNIDRQLPIKNAQIIEILDTYEIIFSYGPFLAGVREADSRKQAEDLALRLYSQISKNSANR
jgi:hypothetical protein